MREYIKMPTCCLSFSCILILRCLRPLVFDGFLVSFVELNPQFVTVENLYNASQRSHPLAFGLIQACTRCTGRLQGG
ncbi:hypothetical protein BGX38DRAFT_1188281 [Terfezia claveryi]|nr:hypothetical protein BGX38DRAFT_1188281 [Terfezia claveryi]